MTRPLPFTESRVRRAIAAVRKEGLAVSAVSIHPDGTVTVFQGVAAPVLPAQDDKPPRSGWEDIQV
jgi:hypothetical protein